MTFDFMASLKQRSTLMRAGWNCWTGGIVVTLPRGRIMKKVLDERLVYEILSVVSEIPFGRVASYGQIAKLIGREKNARLVGNVLSGAERYGEYHCHRVVNHAGCTAPGWSEQRARLEAEGVAFKANGCVDMSRFRWDET